MAMKQKHDKDQPLTFIVFPNREKAFNPERNTLPDWVGKLITEDGEILRLAGWEMTSKDGEKKYIAGRVSEFLTKEEVKQRKEEAAKEKKEEEEDLGLDDLAF